MGLAEDLSGLAPTEGQWTARDALPATLVAILQEAGRTYVPVMLANARVLASKAQMVETMDDGKPWVQHPFAYQGKCLRWLREEFAALSALDQASALRILEVGHCAALIREAIQ